MLQIHEFTFLTNLIFLKFTAFFWNSYDEILRDFWASIGNVNILTEVNEKVYGNQMSSMHAKLISESDKTKTQFDKSYNLKQDKIERYIQKSIMFLELNNAKKKRNEFESSK